jgi:hypothetical protein
MDGICTLPSCLDGVGEIHLFLGEESRIIGLYRGSIARFVGDPWEKSLENAGRCCSMKAGDITSMRVEVRLSKGLREKIGSEVYRL